MRLYVNFFQPSMKLAGKRRKGGAGRRTYLPAKTPIRRLVESDVLSESIAARLSALAQALDPVRLLRQLEQLQDALWRHAVFRTPAPEPLGGTDELELRRFVIERQRGPDADHAPNQRRKYGRPEKSLGPRWWRTRADPSAEVWAEVVTWLEAVPTRTGTSVFAELQRRYPARFADGQRWTLHRRVREWRARRIPAFDAQWLEGEPLGAGRLPRPLRALPAEQPQEPALAAGG